MNFYSSPAFLSTVASVYFPGQRTRPQDFEVDGKIYRFLVVGTRRVITSWTFLDYVEPVETEAVFRPIRRNLYVPNVAQRTVTMQQWSDDESLRSYRPAPFVDFLEYPTFDDYRAFLMKRSKDRFKKNTRLRERLQDDFGQLVFSANDDGDDVLEKSLEWKSTQLRETGLPDLFANVRNREFYAELKKRGVLLSSTLRANGRLLSSWLGYVYEGYWSGWIFTFDHDPALRKYSLGWQLMESLLRSCHDMKLKGFDFSVGHSDYKMTYGTHVRLLGSVGHRPLHQELLHKLRKRTKAGLVRFPKLLDLARKSARHIGR
jgi:hypothetical protein